MTTFRSSLQASPDWPYLASAAVLSTFATEQLRPIGKEPAQLGRVAAMIARHAEPVKAGPARGRWRLREDVRRRVLAALHTQEALSEALAANFETLRHAPTERALYELLSSTKTLPLAGRPLEELLGLQRAVAWLEAAGIDSPIRSDDIARLVARERILIPLRRLVVGFEGREAELKRLREYVDHLPSETFSELVSRGVMRLRDAFRHRPPLVVHGPGGAGKSSLIAKFILQHAATENAHPMPFILLDFDGVALDPANPDALMAHAGEQVRAQFPEELDRTILLQQKLEVRMASEDRDNFAQSGHYAASSSARTDFVTILNEISSRQSQNILLVIDTFEIVQRRGPSAVYNVLQFVAGLLSRTPRLRVVIVGRGQLRREDFQFSDDLPDWLPLPLPGLGSDAGRAYLRRRLEQLQVNTTDDVLDRIVERVNGNPLGLRLAAQVFEREGFAGIDAAIAATQISEAVTEEQVQGMLHGRILDHLESDHLQKLANPGLIVRRITPEVIADVLARPCGIELETVSADYLFDELQREVSLVELVDARSLRHRTDVRQIMLPLLRRKLGPKAREIDSAAVAFWEKKDGAIARAEEIYHRMWRHDALSELERRWREDVSPFLEDALDEFRHVAPSDEIHVWLCQKLRRELPEVLRQSASQRAWEQDAMVKANALLAEAALHDALRVINQRPPEMRRPDSELWLIEADIHQLLDDTEAAIAVLQTALKRAHERGDVSFEIKARLRFVAIFEQRGDFDAAHGAVFDALRAAQQVNDPPSVFAALTRLARIARRIGDADEAAVTKEDMLEMLRKPRFLDWLSTQPTLLRETVAEIGTDTPSLTATAIERFGLDLGAGAERLAKTLSKLIPPDKFKALSSGPRGMDARFLERYLADLVRSGNAPRALLEEVTRYFARSVDRLVNQVQKEPGSDIGVE